MGKLTIVGHKNPDTDSIVSAIAAQEYFKNSLGIDAQAFRAGELNNETKFVLKKFNAEPPILIESVATDNLIALVDHNETTQTFDGLNFSQVAYILDHHKLSLKTEKPVYLRNEPIGSTSSLIAKMFLEKGMEISENTARLLISGILSDTLNLTSPTTTSEDKKLVSFLTGKAKIDIPKFVEEMFEAKSSLEGLSSNDIVGLDYKIYKIGKYSVGAGTWETILADVVNEKKESIMKALREKKDSEKLDYIFFMVVDILKRNCYMYVVNDAEQILAERVFGKNAKSGIIFLKGVVSRKKQIIPPLTEELTK